MLGMGFPRKFVDWVVGLHKNSGTRLCVNGWTGDRIEVLQGVRQGCPLAPYLFLCAVEPLCQEAKRRKLGLSKKGEERLTYLGYADDTTFLLNGRGQLEVAERLLADFAERSGLKTNKAKSSVLPLGRNVRAQAPAGSGFKWVGADETERLLGFWVSPRGDAEQTWVKALARASGELGRWQSSYLTTTARVTVLNAYVMPIFLFQAQVYPPPPAIWKQIKALGQNFVSGNKADAGRHFTLWSFKLMCTPRMEGGLGVLDLRARLDSMAVRNVGVVLMGRRGIRFDLAMWAAGLPQGWASLYAHERSLKGWVVSDRWRQLVKIFRGLPQLKVAVAKNRREVEQERLFFNKEVLRGGGSPFGFRKEEEVRRDLTLGDMLRRWRSGVRELKDLRSLESELGSTAAAKVALKAFAAAPEGWRRLILEPLATVEIAGPFKVVRTKATVAGVRDWWWEVVGEQGGELRCRSVWLGADGRVKKGAETGEVNFCCSAVVPMVTEGDLVVGEAGAPLTRLLMTGIRKGAEVARAKDLRVVVGAGELTTQQRKWVERRGGEVNWKKVFGQRDSLVTQSKARDVLLRIHCFNLQVGERLSFHGTGCPHCMGVESLEHCLYSCPVIQGVLQALRRALGVMNPSRRVHALEDLLFQEGGTRSGFPESTLISITWHKIWKERCDAVFRGEKFQGRRVLGRINVAFNLHARIYVGSKGVGSQQGVLGQGGRMGLEDDEARMLRRIVDSTAKGMTWSPGFQSIWADPRTFVRPP